MVKKKQTKGANVCECNYICVNSLKRRHIATIMKKKRTTIKDIAKILNTNVSTVSRALNDHPSISDKTKKRVRQMARELNYRHNGIASSLRRGNTKTIGLIVPHINRNFFSNVIYGVESVAKKNGYQVIIAQSNEEYESERDAIKTLINNRVDGVVLSIAKTTRSHGHLQNLIDAGIALVQFDRIRSELSIPSVTNDNLRGGYEAAAHLIEQGYRRIAHYAGPRHVNIYKERFDGYRQALQDHDLPFDESIVFEDLITQEVAYERTRQLFSEPNAPDAIFAAGDFGALGALLALRELDVRTPDEVGVVGFANEPFTHLTSPGLTSLDQHSQEMGKTAARLLVDEMQRKDTLSITKVMTIKPTLIVRESSLRTKK